MLRALFALLALTPSAAALEWPDFDALPADQQAVFILGAGAAFEYANAHATLNGETEIYCTGTVDPSEFVRISADTRDATVPVELSLMLGLQDEYPCPAT